MKHNHKGWSVGQFVKFQEKVINMPQVCAYFSSVVLLICRFQWKRNQFLLKN